MKTMAKFFPIFIVVILIALLPLENVRALENNFSSDDFNCDPVPDLWTQVNTENVQFFASDTHIEMAVPNDRNTGFPDLNGDGRYGIEEITVPYFWQPVVGGDGFRADVKFDSKFDQGLTDRQSQFQGILVMDGEVYNSFIRVEFQVVGQQVNIYAARYRNGQRAALLPTGYTIPLGTVDEINYKDLVLRVQRRNAKPDYVWVIYYSLNGGRTFVEAGQGIFSLDFFVRRIGFYAGSEGRSPAPVPGYHVSFDYFKNYHDPYFTDDQQTVCEADPGLPTRIPPTATVPPTATLPATATFLPGTELPPTSTVTPTATRTQTATATLAPTATATVTATVPAVEPTELGPATNWIYIPAVQR